jgi:hypothetical protein
MGGPVWIAPGFGDFLALQQVSETAEARRSLFDAEASMRRIRAKSYFAVDITNPFAYKKCKPAGAND